MHAVKPFVPNQHAKQAGTIKETGYKLMKEEMEMTVEELKDYLARNPGALVTVTLNGRSNERDKDKTDST